MLMGLAMKQIRTNDSVVDAELSPGYELNSSLKIMSTASSLMGSSTNLKASRLNTPLGPMMAIADDDSLYLLEFVDCHGLEREIERLRIKTKSAIIPGRTAPIDLIEQELNYYFKGCLKQFDTPLFLSGSSFQKTVWNALQTIRFGETCSYAALAKNIGNPSACRAVANANGANQIAIVIPCHRVINTNGKLGGYAGGVSRKKWMIEHEKNALRMD